MAINLCTIIDDLYYVFAMSTFIITGSITLKGLNVSYNNIVRLSVAS